MQTNKRKEYLKEYRLKNKERIREYNKKKYLERKKKSENRIKDYELLKLLEERKKVRLELIESDTKRKRRRQKTQQYIYMKLSEECLTKC